MPCGTVGIKTNGIVRRINDEGGLAVDGLAELRCHRDNIGCCRARLVHDCKFLTWPCSGVGKRDRNGRRMLTCDEGVGSRMI